MGPKSTKQSDYEQLLAQERLILDATEAVVVLLQEQNVSRQELARRIGKSKGFVSQLLSGERNMTLRTLADLGHALGCAFSVVPNRVSTPAVDADALRSIYAAFSSSEVSRSISAETVKERLRETEEFSVDVRDYHEYALAA
jgi:transcriptional regulator with XRE-family HTH domain